MQEGPTYLAKSNHCFIRTTPGRGCKKHPVRFAKSWSRGRAQHHSLLEAMGAQGAQGILRSLRHTALVSAVSWQCLEEVSRASLNTWLVHLFVCGSNAVCKNRRGNLNPFPCNTHSGISAREPTEDLEASVIPGRMDRAEFVPQHPDKSHKD